MTREQAINYLISSGFTHEQVGEVVRALTYDPTTKNDLGVEEVTALAEWTAKLTKASEDAYNKGYEDGMKAQAEPKTKIEESNFSREQYALDIDTAWKCGYEAEMKAQEPILDKIRAEIEQKLGTHGNISLYNRAIYDVLMIIDKYKAESE